MSKNWEHAAGVLWPVLVDAAKNKKNPTYSDIAPLINTNPLNVGRALGPILFHCMDYKLPPLTSIIIGKNSGIPGDGFIAWDVDDLDSAHQLVYEYDWEKLKNPFGGFDENDSIESFSDTLVQHPEKSEEIYRKVKVRGPAQAVFRKALLKAYDNECAICGLSFVEALEAAHILPWSKSLPKDRISPCNGILLCSNHHKLFDAGWLKVTEDLKIMHVDKDYEENYYGDADIAATVNVNNMSLKLPESEKLWPSIALIRQRYEKKRRG
jgi:putative restriction endonuclease